MTASQRATIKCLRENPSRNRFNVQDKQQRAHPKPADQFTMVVDTNEERVHEQHLLSKV